MEVAQGRREERRQRLLEWLERDPLRTDQELSRDLGVSVQTVRLDRMALGIPELRERTRMVARRVLGQSLRSMGTREVVGELVDLELGRRAVSVLDTDAQMGFERSLLVRSQYIFAQADSLALAVIDAPWVLTGLARVKFRRPVRVGERLVSKAVVLRSKQHKYVVLVTTTARQDEVFRGKFLVAALEDSKPGNTEVTLANEDSG